MTTHWDDVSHHNAGFVATRAVVWKATEGVSFADPSYPAGVARSIADKHHVFAYHGLHTGSIVAQAEWAFGKIGDRPMMPDVEMWRRESGSPAGIARLSEVVLFVTEFRRLGGVVHVAYLPRSAWQEMGRPDLRPLETLGVRVMNANYLQHASDSASSPAFEAYGNVTPFANQFTDEPHDQNLAHMSWEAALRIWRTGK